MNRSEVVKALGRVMDPASGQDIIAAHLVENLKIEEKRVSFDLSLPPASASSKFELHAACVEAVKNGVKAAVILNGKLSHSILLEIFTEHGVGTLITN